MHLEEILFFFSPDAFFFLFICMESQSFLFTMTHFQRRGVGGKRACRGRRDHRRGEEERGG